MNVTISCIFTAFQGLCANLNFIKLAGFFCISPTSCLLAKRKTKVCVLLWIWQTLTFSPGVPMAPWGPGSPCGQEGEFFFFFFFFPMMFFFNLWAKHKSLISFTQLSMQPTWVPGLPCCPGGPGSPWGPYEDVFEEISLQIQGLIIQFPRVRSWGVIPCRWNTAERGHK